MRGFLIVLIFVGLGIVYLRQKQSEPASIAAKPVPAQPVGATASPIALTPAPRGEASEYNWMKRALDRTRDVTEKTRAQTKQSQDP
jgi:hypothetical protein